MAQEDEGVALESCEFWMACCEAQMEPALLRPYLGALIPMLLKNMARRPRPLLPLLLPRQQLSRSRACAHCSPAGAQSQLL